MFKKLSRIKGVVNDHQVLERIICKDIFISSSMSSPKYQTLFRAYRPICLDTGKRQFSKATTGIDSPDEDEEPLLSGKPYDDAFLKNHIPTTTFQKALLSVGSAFMALYDPYRDDMVAACGEASGYYALKTMKAKMENHETGSRILQEQPRINTETVNLESLRKLGDDTFGKIYVNWLDKYKLTPDARLPVHFVDDPDLAYVMQRYREAHDLIHTLLGMPPNMLGEVGVKWVEGIQFRLPMCVSGAVFGPLRFRLRRAAAYSQVVLPWAVQTGYQAEFLLNVYFEEQFSTPLEQLRSSLRIPPPPDISGL